MFHRVPVRILSMALVAFATTLSARPSPTLHEVLARAADAMAAFADPSHRIVCQENDRQTTVIDLAPIDMDWGYGPQQVAYRDIIASWSMTSPSPDGSVAWNEVRDVESLGVFQPFPSKRADPRVTAMIDRTIDVPAPLPRLATEGRNGGSGRTERGVGSNYQRGRARITELYAPTGEPLPRV